MTYIILLLSRILASSPSVRDLSRRIRAANLTFVSKRKLRRLASVVYAARMATSQGAFIEAGVALGGTAILISKLKPSARQLLLYDVFGMIPPPGENDCPDALSRYEVISSGKAVGIGGETYYGYRDDMTATVANNLKTFGVDLDGDNVYLVQGIFENTLHPSEPVAFAHVDCDWYDSVMVCIERIWPVMVRGGIMLFDDYRSYEGCKKAVDKFLSEANDYTLIFSDVSLAVMKK